MLVLAGVDDKLVPWEVSRTFVERLEVGRGGRKTVMVVPGVKHEFTDGTRGDVSVLLGGGTRSRWYSELCSLKHSSGS